MSQLRIWYSLVQADGKPFSNSTVASVLVPSSAIVDDLRKAVKAENVNDLAKVDARRLKVFKDKEDLNGEPLDEEFLASDLGEAGKRKKGALLVLVPDVAPPSSSETVENLKDYLVNLPLRLKELLNEERENEARMSTAGSDFVNGLLDDLNIDVKMKRGAISEALADDVDVAAFVWHASKEESRENRTNYIRYIRDILSLNDNTYFFTHDVASDDRLLDLAIRDRYVKGTADVIISASEGFVAKTAQIVFEMQKPDDSKNKFNQIVLEVLSAQYKSSYGVVGVLTDLVDNWRIFWFEKADDGQACLVETRLTRQLAVGFLRLHLALLKSMMDKNETKIRPEFDPDYDRDKDEDIGRKRRRIMDKSHPSFNATNVVRIRSSAIGALSGDIVTEDQVFRAYVMNWIRDHPGSDLKLPRFMPMTVDIEE
jgi:hypothetical protein